MRFFDFPISIPTYTSSTDKWSETTFTTRGEFTQYVESQFKLPGEYNLKNTKKWKEVSIDYKNSCKRPNLEGGRYSNAIKGTASYQKFWGHERDKCKKGAIYDGVYVPPFYYFYLNFCPFNDGARGGKKSFALVMDNDLYFFHYLMLCILKNKHACVLKKRQAGYSLKIMSVLYWSYTWFEGTVNTVGAIDEGKVIKSWRFVELYKAHCDLNTDLAFKRGPVKPKTLDWVERIELKEGGYTGLNSQLKGTTFQKNFDAGVGGAQTFFFYEEAGIAPTMLKTIGYIRPAIERGTLVSGTIIASGALGELDDAQDLKEIFYNPDAHNFLSVTNIWDKDPMYAGKPCGLFVSEAYNMEGDDPETGESMFYDEDGNSNVELALTYIEKWEEELKASGKSAELVQLDISQKITSPEKGFAARKDGFFPVKMLHNHKDRLLIEKPHIIKCELYEDNTGDIKYSFVDREPIVAFPFKGKGDADKRGAVCILELPKVEKGEKEPAARMYFAGIDPIQTDITTTSESLFCIYIFKNVTKVRYQDKESGEIKIKTEGYKPVAWYIGRYDDRKQTNEQAEFLLRMYNAYALVERNVTSFIDHMRAKNMDHKYLMPQSEANRIYGEDVVVETSVDRGYGIHMSSNGKLKVFLLNKQKEYIQDVIDIIRKPNNEIVRTVYGCERIADEGYLNEAMGYTKKENTDRLVAFGLALAACEMYVTSGITTEYDEVKDKAEDYIPIKIQRGFFSPKRRRF
jgi:hypothetical protein